MMIEMDAGSVASGGAPAVDPHELHAAKVAIEGTPLERLGLAARSLGALLTNPEDTRQVFYLGMVLSSREYPRFLARVLNHPEGIALFRDKPGIDSKSVDFDALRRLPADTLGGAYVRHLDDNGLDPDLFQAPPGLPEVPAYLSQRMRQVHDLWHVLTGYATDVRGEVALQAFSWAQSDMPAPALIVLGGIARWGWSDPAMLPLAIEGYRRGRRAAFLAPLRLEDRFEHKLADVRRELAIEA